MSSTNQAIGEVVEWATDRTFKRGEAGRMTGVNSLRSFGQPLNAWCWPSAAQKMAAEDQKGNSFYRGGYIGQHGSQGFS